MSKSLIVIGFIVTIQFSVIFTAIVTVLIMKRKYNKERALAGTRVQNSDNLNENNSEQFS